MSRIGREFKFERNFGPYIVKTTMSDELYDILLKGAYKIKKNKKTRKDNDYRDSLAGNLAEEYHYGNILTPEEDHIVSDELKWLASTFTKFSKKAIGTDYGREPKDIILLKPVWVNFMKQGEWNPSHSHTGDISCVAYLKVPKEIDEENRSSETSSKSNTPAAGKIEFMYGDHIGYTNTGTIRTPKEKEIFFFPARLLHQVYPFKSKSERISISANFADATIARKNLNGEGER